MHERSVDIPNIKDITLNLSPKLVHFKNKKGRLAGFSKFPNIFFDIGLKPLELALLLWFLSHSDEFLPTQTQGVKDLGMDSRTFKKTLSNLIAKLDRHAEMVNMVSSDLKDFEEKQGVVKLQPLVVEEGLLNYKGGGCKITRDGVVKLQPNKNKEKNNKKDIKEKIYKKESEIVFSNPSPPTSGDISFSFDDPSLERSKIKSEIIQQCNKNPQTIQQLVENKHLFNLHLDYYLDYFINLPPKKRVKSPYLQFLNSIRADWGNIRRNNQPVKTFKEKHMEQMKSDFLANASESTKDYMRRVTEFNENRLKNAQGGKI